MKHAQLVLKSNAIFDSVKNEPFEGAVAIDGDKIVYCGNKAGVEDFIGPYTQVKDFGDRLITPGICEGHGHILGTIVRECTPRVSLYDSPSEEDCAKRSLEFSNEHPELPFVYGSGWMLNNWPEGSVFPTKKSIDALIPDRAVYLQSGDGHTFWLNSKAIEESGILAFAEANKDWLQEDWFVRDEKGEPTGVFKEGYVGLLMDITQTFPRDLMVKYKYDYVKLMNKYGITGINEMTVFDPADIVPTFADFKELERQGELTMRMYLYPDYTKGKKGIYGLLDLIPFFNTDQMRIVGFKQCADGIPATRTAASLEPYADDPSTCGEFAKPKEQLLEEILTANKYGLPVRTHCTGDAAVRFMLDCYEESLKVNGDKGLRNAIEHMDRVDDADLPRFKELGVTASIQPAHLIMDNNLRVERFGKERSKYDWGFRRLFDEGKVEHWVVGTDSPVVSCNPYENIYMAVTRKKLDGTSLAREGGGDQAMTMAEVLKGYTYGSAWISYMDDKVGTLEAGKYADITVSNCNLFKADEDQLRSAHCVCTVFNGKVVYEE